MTPSVAQAGPNGLVRKIPGKQNSNGLLVNFGPDWKRASFSGNKEKRKPAAQGMWAKIIMGCRIFF
jgi:hypothetical protein